MKVIDFHCDALWTRSLKVRDGEECRFDSNSLHIDLQKLEKGDYMLQCFALFEEQCPDHLKKVLEQIDAFYSIMAAYPDRIAPVTTYREIMANREKGKISAMLTVEDGGCCMGSIGVLHQLYRLGARIMTLTWNFENDLASPNIVPQMRTRKSECLADEKHGLKEKGFEFLHEMEKIGMIADVSHLSDAGFWDIARTAKRPFIASHSNARAVSGHVRNLTDDMIRAIADHGGVTGLNYYPSFLDTKDDLADCISSLDWMVKHVQHIRNIAGIDVIALGSDFDGIDGNLELKDCSMVQLLADKLLHSGFTSGEVEKIFHGNALRILKEFL